MPRIVNEKKSEVKKEPIKKAVKNSKTTSEKKDISKNKVTQKKESTKKSSIKEKKVKTEKEKSVKKVSSSTAKSKASKKSNTKAKKVSLKKVEILEYYDLPLRYNQTVVKILAQTPTNLFVYWDISDEDKTQYIKQYGDFFFQNTKPVLKVYNITKKYSFEVDINDFANSWYLSVQDSNCDYKVELGRRPINEYVHIDNNYLFITNSNEMFSQNDHILFEKLSHFVFFKNVKTNKQYKKNIVDLTLLQKFGKLDYSFIKEFYRKLYPNEVLNFDKLDLRNPSSGNPTSSFK